MVMQYGMSESLGLRTYGEQQGNIFLGREIGSNRDYSEEAARLIDIEVRGILDRNYGRAKEIITENRNKLVTLVETLLEVETLDRHQFEEVMNREPGRSVDQPVGAFIPGD
jgi:cell division protease FtsH